MKKNKDKRKGVEQETRKKKNRKDLWNNFQMNVFDVVLCMKQKQIKKAKKQREKNKDTKESKKERK